LGQILLKSFSSGINWHVSLYLNDKETACVPFISIDPEKKLRQVGEAIEIVSGIRIKTETLVTAVVDSTLNVNETDETNNKKSVRLKCDM